jgi:isopentenyl diphosphate isomerase/L-lactate dehydrogenase-like FMN-dependent dehydrogenase
MAFRNISLLPNPLQGTTVRDQSIELFGERLPRPVLIGPTGLTGMLWPRSEIDRVMALCGWDRLEQIDRSVLFDPAVRPESVLSAVGRKLTAMWT